MIRKYLIIGTALAFSMTAFAQKDEIKAAEKALKNKNAAEAVKILNGAESLISNAAAEEQAQYYFLKGKSHLDLANVGVEKSKNYIESAKAFGKVEEIEKISGKNKFTKQIGNFKIDAINAVKKIAYDDYTEKKYIETAKAYKILYDLEPNEPDYLYDGANAAIMGLDYDLALTYLEKLKEIDYTGEGTYYKAVNKLNDKVEYFYSKKERDDAVRLGTYEKPSEEKKQSKRGEIYKNIALIYVQKGKTEEAKKALQDAKKINPDDISIATAEAEIYLKLNDFDNYSKIVKEILEKQPNNADLVFNLGVVSYNGKDFENAEKHYKRAIEIDQNYTKAYYNLGVLKIDESQIILDEMNKLGLSKAEMVKYDKLKEKRDKVLYEVVKYFEKTLQLDSDNEDAKTALVSVYSALDLQDKAKAMKATLK